MKLAKKGEVTGSQKSGLRHTERTGTYPNSCVNVCGLKDTSSDPAVQFQATFQSSRVCAEAQQVGFRECRKKSCPRSATSE